MVNALSLAVMAARPKEADRHAEAFSEIRNFSARKGKKKDRMSDP
jgi:hypothetical protein